MQCPKSDFQDQPQMYITSSYLVISIGIYINVSIQTSMLIPNDPVGEIQKHQPKHANGTSIEKRPHIFLDADVLSVATRKRTTW